MNGRGGKNIFVQFLLLCVTVVFAFCMIYIKSTQSTQVMSYGIEQRRNLTFEDLAKRIFEDGVERYER